MTTDTVTIQPGTRLRATVDTGRGPSIGLHCAWIYRGDQAKPEPRIDVQAWRDDHNDGTPGWDTVYWDDDDDSWHSATYCGERIAPPEYWFSLPVLAEDDQ
jgi:hypothetical protein